jgi:RES domain-containing protein
MPARAAWMTPQSGISRSGSYASGFDSSQVISYAATNNAINTQLYSRGGDNDRWFSGSLAQQILPSQQEFEAVENRRLLESYRGTQMRIQEAQHDNAVLMGAAGILVQPIGLAQDVVQLLRDPTNPLSWVNFVNPVNIPVGRFDNGFSAVMRSTSSGFDNALTRIDVRSSNQVVSQVDTLAPPSVTFEGSLYRVAAAGNDPLFVHPKNVLANHRYTAPGIGGLYFSSSARIAQAEVTSNGGSLTGMVTHSFENKSLSGLLDLSNPAVREQLGVSLTDIVRSDGAKTWRYEVTHRLGSYARQSGYQGLIAPSAQADGGVNVIIFGK